MDEATTRNLVVCCDGTWNTEDQTDAAGLPVPTNVMKLHAALVRDEASDAPDAPGAQLAYYHPGVGTYGGWLRRAWDGAFGDGLTRDVKDAYAWLARIYRPGDRIFIFGFSRGAYTARALAGVVTHGGLLDLYTGPVAYGAQLQLIDDVFRRTMGLAAPTRVPGARYFHDDDATRSHAKPPATPVWFVGVWDTVGSLGIPDDLGLPGWLERRRFQFRNRTLNPKVIHARHAVALDETRSNFQPTLWQEPDPLPEGSTFRQIWFPGAHSDVGGGYAETGLSDGTLKWMIGEAKEPIRNDPTSGLRFLAGVTDQITPNALGPQHRSVIGIYEHLTTTVRPAPLIVATATDLHASVLARFATPPISHGPYWQGGTLAVGQSRTAEVAANAVWAWTGIYLEKGVPYEFKAEGEWMDASIPADADGRVTRWSLPILFWVACRAILGNPPTWLQSGWRKITGNPRAAFRIARRQPRGRWFELVGVIGNNRIEVSRMAVRNEAFSIGTSATHRPRRSGYLYCYANDTWTAYGNNRGSLKLIVSRNALDAHSPTPGASHPPKWTDGGDPKEE